MSFISPDNMSPKRSATNQRAYGLLLLTLVGFGATTLLLSFRLMSAETLDRSVSPRTLIAEEQQVVRVSASHFTEPSHDTRPPWRPNFRRNRGRGANKRASSMLQTHYRQEHKPLTTNRTIDNPCPNGKMSRSDNTGIPSHCTGYSLPFTTTNVPNECWPRIFLLPSYPTSGNELVHVLFQRITGLISFNSFPLGQAAFDLSTLNHAGLVMSYDEKEFCQTNSSLSIPVAGQVVLSKNHYRHQTGGPNPGLFKSSPQQRLGNVGGNIAGIVRLARNPGDHLLRNFFRWDHRDCHHDSCFYQQAKSTCPILESKASDWNQFHSFWDDYDSSVPQLIMHYEEFSNRATAVRVFETMMEFVAAKEAEPGTLQQKVFEFVREPTYEQGGLVAKVCGVQVARRLHKLTAEYSARLGYEFDHDRGIWSLTTENTRIMVS